MPASSFAAKLAVCSWSLQPRDPAELIRLLAATGIPRVQLALDPLREGPGIWGETAGLLRRHGVELASGMFGCAGEDYTTPASIRRTGGIVPDATWEQNWKNIRANADRAAGLGLKLVTFHAGFLPDDPRDPAFGKLQDRLNRIADLFGAHGIALGLETGQETADTLRAFLEKLRRPEIGVNFDPANMILYGKGDPIAALRTLGPWLKQCHVKDARKPRAPGAWGDEVRAGAGEVDWPAFFRALRELAFAGGCCIEREAGAQRLADIQTAKRLVESLD